jgi:hypothetical protein
VAGPGAGQPALQRHQILALRRHWTVSARADEKCTCLDGEWAPPRTSSHARRLASRALSRKLISYLAIAQARPDIFQLSFSTVGYPVADRGRESLLRCVADRHRRRHGCSLRQLDLVTLDCSRNHKNADIGTDGNSGCGILTKPRKSNTKRSQTLLCTWGNFDSNIGNASTTNTSTA